MNTILGYKKDGVRHSFLETYDDTEVPGNPSGD